MCLSTELCDFLHGVGSVADDGDELCGAASVACEMLALVLILLNLMGNHRYSPTVTTSLSFQANP